MEIITPPLPDTPDPSQQPDPLPGIHYAKDLDKTLHDQLRESSGMWTTFSSLQAEVAGLGLLVLCYVAFCVLRTGPIPSGTSSVTYFALLAFAILALWLDHRARNRRLQRLLPQRTTITTTYPELSDPRYRIRIVGTPLYIDVLRSLPFDVAASFEPLVFRMSSADEPLRIRRRKAAALIAGGLAVVIFMDVVFATMSDVYSTVFTGCLLGRLTLSFAWPTYVRVAPGRLDIFQYPFLGRGVPRVRTYDLRTADLVVSLNGPAMVMKPPDLNGEVLPSGTNAWTDPEPFYFERTLLLAALTTAPTPPLPDDALIG